MSRHLICAFLLTLTCAVAAGCGDNHPPVDDCEADPASCETEPVCGDGAITGAEACDDGAASAGDGCDAACAIEHGWACAGAPSSCTTTCGDGLVGGDEACDDGDTDDGDGCDGACAAEPGWVCTGEPSACVATCGDGVISGAEACDDDDTEDGDGCDDNCAIEDGFACTGAPSVCVSDCGDGVVAADEACDDGGEVAGDGCSDACAVEPGWVCTGVPSTCASECGDGVIASDEDCDDVNTYPSDGCSPSCTVEHGYTCVDQPSACASACGDGVIASDEACDDDDTEPGDGCDAGCAVEAGWACHDEPSGCAEICGDGVIVGDEPCDDDNDVELDGCSNTCTVDRFDEVEPNDAPGTAEGPYPAGLRFRGAIAPPDDVDHVEFVLTRHADVAIETFDDEGGCASIDTEVTLLAADGATVIAHDDDSGAGRCSRLDPGNAAVAHLAPGTYLLAIRSHGGDQLIAGYSVTVRLLADCGDLVTEGSEECDGGAGCAASCERLADCGDGHLDGGEICDDGNEVADDGCSPGCGWEVRPEAEPNDTTAQATGPLAPPKLLGGAIGAAGDVDVYAITLPATADLRAETFDGAGPGHCAGIDTVLTLYGSDGTTVLLERDQGGLDDCSRIDPSRATDAAARHLPAGTYYLMVRDYLGDGAIAGYTVHVALDALCGDGVTGGGEECDGGDGCTETCDRIPDCGDGHVDAPESCDDGGETSGDGCSDACVLELLAEVEPNDDATAAAANPALVPVALVGGAISPIGDADVYAVTLAVTTDLVVQTSPPDGPCEIDTEVTLLAADGTTVLASNDDSGGSSCAALWPSRAPGARHLAPGTYFVTVRERNDDGAIPAYRALISAATTCGDGVTAGYEECDGGATCTATCDRIADCGDGHVDAPETCDDGGETAGDGCDAACALETAGEVEPNGVVAEADAAAVQLSGAAYVTGAIDAIGDHDLFRLTLAADDVYRLETFSAAGACTIATTVRLLDAAGTELVSDRSSGLGRCSALSLHLVAGTYYLQVEEQGDDATIAGYLLAITAPASAGAEAEPNGTRGTATAVAGPEVFVLGGHQAAIDLDHVAIEVPHGKSLRAEVIEGGAESCESNGIDSLLSLYDGAGALLGRDDDGGRGYCSLIDGTGATPAQPFASGLSAGTYVLAVDASAHAQNSDSDAARFDYRLVIVVR